MTLEQTRQALDAQLSSWVSGPFCAAPVDRWVAASGLQKGIRRGDTGTALACAKTLLMQDPQRLWRRLAVIGIEDVGIADLDTAAQVLSVSGQKVWRREHGGDELIASYLIAHLCQSAKERSCDDLVAIADLHPDLRKQRLELAYAGTDELRNVISDNSREIGLRALAAWYLAGTERLPGKQLIPRRGAPDDLFCVYEALGISEPLIELCHEAITKTRTALSVMLPLIWLAERGTGVPVCSDLPEVPVVHGVPAYVFDGFSRVGRRALTLFLSECVAVRDFIKRQAPRADRVALTAVLVFHAEGGLVDRRLTWSGSEPITREGVVADIVGRGLAIEKVTEALALMRDHMPALHKARDRAAAQAASPLEPTLL